MGLFRKKVSAGPPPVPVDVDPFLGDPDLSALRGLMLAQDWPAVETLLGGATDPDELTYFISAASDTSGAETWLADVAGARLDSQLAQLLYGARTVEWAWEARGGAYAQHVGSDRFALFFERLRIAEDCLQGVVRRDPTNATAWVKLMHCAIGLRLSIDEIRSRFDRAVAIWPQHFEAHLTMMQALCQKWYGSHEQMHEFVRTSMSGAPAGSPLAVLVARAHLEHWLSLRGEGEPYVQSAEVRASLREAADRSVRHPAYRRGRYWASVHNSFAMAFAIAGDHDRAAEQFRIIGDVRTQMPWGYYGGSASKYFAALRQRAYAEAKA